MTLDEQQPQPVETAPEGPGKEAQADYDKGKQFLENNDPTQAAAAFHNALVGFEEVGDEAGIARAADRLGDLCLEREEFDRAADYFDRARAICEQHKDGLSLVTVDKKLVQVRRGQKRYEEAVRICLDLLDAYQQYNNPDGAVRVLEDLAEIYQELGDIQRAADALRTAAAIHANFKHRRHAEAFMSRAETMEAGS